MSMIDVVKIFRMPAHLIGDAPPTPEAENRRLRARIAELEEENLQLRATGNVDFRLIRALGLTRRQSQILSVLRSRKEVGRESMCVALFTISGDAAPDSKCIDVHMSKLRPKLRRCGVEIETLVGFGWRMPTLAKDRLNQFEASIGDDARTALSGKRRRTATKGDRKP